MNMQQHQNPTATAKAGAVKPATKPVYYWLDGYWIEDREAAQVLSDVNAFGSKHGVAFFPVTATEQEIDAGVIELLKQ